MSANRTSRDVSSEQFNATRQRTAVEPLVDRTAPLALSSSQQRLWFLAQMQGASEAYHMPLAVRLRGRLDREALTRALDALVARHEVLRTRLVSIAGEAFQQVGPADTGFPLQVHDFTGLADAEARLAAVQREEATAPFDLTRGCPVRGRLVVLGAEQHVLLLTPHHIAFDGWSMGVLTRELGVLYDAFRRGGADPLPPLPVQYADYAAWQRRWMEQGGPAEQVAYWKSVLAGAPELLELPTDRPRPAEQDFSGGRLPLVLDEELTAALKDLGQQHRASLFMTVLAAWALVLSRMAGQDDVVIGTPAANRRRPELEGAIGCFVNTLALRIDLAGAPTVSELLQQVRRVTLEALEHQDLPFEQVVELANPARSMAHTPLFQATVAWHNGDEGELELPGLQAELLDSSYPLATFDLALSLAEVDGRVVGTLEYATALFDAGTAERCGRYLRRVLEQMAQQPGRGTAALSLLDEQERRQLLVDWNDTARATGAAGLMERFEAQVRERPGQLALVCDEAKLDYATLEQRANRLAHALIARGVRPGQVVGLHTTSSAELVVGILGVLKTGAAYMPLDPALPQERLSGMVADAAAALVLSNADAPPAGWLSLSAVEAEAGREDAPGIVPRPADLAYVIYTSGSTGRPKGVGAMHGNILNLLDNWLAEFEATPGEASALWPSFAFDASVQEILLPLIVGGVLHLVPDDLRSDPAALTGWLRTHGIVQILLPPAFVKWFDEAPAERLEGLALRHLLTGLEPLPEDTLHRLEQQLPGLRILNGYGPTETTLYCTTYLGPRPLARQCPIGRPLANTRVYLLDERLEPVPVGVAGEMYVAGAGLARGYLGRPDLTAERFVPDPFVSGERMYRTGDLARWSAEGQLVYAGRRDHQVKVRGFRIELGEIEAALLAQPGVQEAAVLADRDGAGEPRLVACVARGEEAPLPAGQWRTALSERLPEYMIPSLYVEVPQLPQTANGKLDRAALLERARTGGPAQVNQASPRDQIELRLYQIWQRLLLQPEIGIGDSFFDIGGTSISAIKMAHAIREEFGEELPIRDIMLHPTIEALGGRLRRGASGKPESNLIEFRKGEGRRRVVCVHPAGGTAFCYLSLAKALPEDCGVYGIQSPGVNPGEEFLPTVEAMAEAYLKLIEPLLDGPLVLSGLSYGGLVAHEMGRLLAQRGHTGLSVVLLDALGTDDEAARTQVEPADMAEFREKLVKFNGMYPGIDDRQIDQYFHIYNHNRLSTRDYLAPPSRARTVLMQAVGDGTDTDGLREVRAFWQRRAEDGFEVEPVNCDHWEMLESAEVLRIATRIESELALMATPHAPPAAGQPGESAAAQQEA